MFSGVSFGCLCASLLATTQAAAGTGESIIAIVSVCINAALLIANAVIDIYRKWRDRDSDLKEREEQKEEKKENKEK